MFGKRRKNEEKLLQTRVAELEAVTTVAKAIAETGDLDGLCVALGKALRTIFGVEITFVALYDKHTGILSFPYFSNGDQIAHIKPVALDSGPTKCVLETRKALVLDEEELRSMGAVNAFGESKTAKRWVGVPILHGGEAIGALSVQSYDSRKRFAPSDIETLQLLASFVADFVENAKSRELERRRVTRLSILTEIGNALAAARGEEPLFQAVHQQIGRLFDAKYFYIATYAEGAPYWNACYTYQDGKRLPPERFPAGRGLCGWLLKSRKPLIIGTKREMEDFVSANGIDAIGGTPQSWIGVPMSVGDRIYGVMALEDYERMHAYDEEDLTLFSLIGVQTAIAIQNSRLYDEVRRAANEMAALVDIGREVTSSLEIGTVLERISRKARELLTRDSSAVYLADESGKLTIAAAAGKLGVDPGSIGAETGVIAPGEGVIGDVVRNGITRVVNAPDVAFGAPAGWTRQARGEKLMAIPIADRGSPLGALAVWRGMDEADFDDAALSLAAGLARQAAVAISNARSYALAQKAKNEAEEANRLKSRFLANMSHELRTPLNAIINFAYLIKLGTEGPVTDAQCDLLGRVEEAGHHLLGLINDVLDLAKIESGKLELAFESCDPVELARGVLSTAGALVKDKPITLVDALPERLPRIQADRTRFRQVLLNLISNAAKFTEKGEITITARARADESRVAFTVRDTGVGIAQADIEKIFVEFVQLDGELTRKHGGTGLGLPISRKFVEMHGGRMSVESEPGVGSAFTFTIPFAPAGAAGGEARSAAPNEAVEASSEPAKVLFIDDDAITREALTRLLAKGRYHVIPLSDSRKAAEEARAKKPDAILLDIMMPNASGWDVIRELKADPTTRDIPVVMCSIAQEADRALSLSASAFIAKPVDGAELQRTLSRIAKPGGTVLAIDDDENMLRIVSKILGRLDYRVYTAPNGAKGLESINESAPDAIVLDLMMPGVNGFDILAELSRNEETRDIPVIVVTAKDLDPDERAIIMRQVTALLEKGVFKPSDLDEAIKASLRARAAKR
jgi:signal transduction histidine kinase/CheY-like chemotaxis protein/putative methionine-R-sulfoxide reductase with GAF domain